MHCGDGFVVVRGGGDQWIGMVNGFGSNSWCVKLGLVDDAGLAKIEVELVGDVQFNCERHD